MRLVGEISHGLAGPSPLPGHLSETGVGNVEPVLMALPYLVVGEGEVRQGEVHEVEGRLRRREQQTDEVPDLLGLLPEVGPVGSSRLGVFAAGEVLPTPVERRQSVLEGRWGGDVAIENGRIQQQAWKPLRQGRPVVGHCGMKRCEIRERLHRDDPVGVFEQREQIAREAPAIQLARQSPQLEPPRVGEEVAARENRRDGDPRGEVHRSRISIPGGGAGQLGEIRVAPAVDLAVLVQERSLRQLVEDDHHDRRQVAAGEDPVFANRIFRGQERAHGATAQEQDWRKNDDG